MQQKFARVKVAIRRSPHEGAHIRSATETPNDIKLASVQTYILNDSRGALLLVPDVHNPRPRSKVDGNQRDVTALGRLKNVGGAKADHGGCGLEQSK